MTICFAEAPAKVILLGEHWVVHGGLAIATAIGIYARARGRASAQGIIVRSRELGVSEDITSCKRFCNLRKAVEYISSRVSRQPWPAEIYIESDIPMGAGMGSSAAVAVAFSACYAALGGIKPDPELVSRAAYEAEKIVHGNPSGIDNTVSAIGGFVKYRRGEGAQSLNVSSLPGAKLLVIDTGIPRSTRAAVSLFTQRLHFLGSLGKGLLSLMEQIVEEAINALKRSDVERIGILLDVAHGLLNSMGVSHEVLEEVIHIARRSGAYGAKLTGAGMGGTAIALVPEKRLTIVKNALQQRGFRVYEASLGVNGVKVVIR